MLSVILFVNGMLSACGRLFRFLLHLPIVYQEFGAHEVLLMFAAPVRAVLAGVGGDYDPVWLLDSGAVWHFTSLRDLLDNVKQVSRRIKVLDASGRDAYVTERGILGKWWEVMVVPTFGDGTHLLSVAQICKIGFICVFLEREALLIHESDITSDMSMDDIINGRTNIPWLRVPSVNGLYEIKHSVLVAALRTRHQAMQVHAVRCGCGGTSDHDRVHCAYTVGSSGRRKGESRYWYWHNRLHVSDTVLHEMAKAHMIDVPLWEFSLTRPECTVCMQARATRQPHRRRKERISRPGELISMDLMYVSTPGLYGGERYTLMVTDAASGMWWTYFLKTRDQVVFAAQRWFDREARPSGHKITKVKVDRAGEFQSKAFTALMDTQGVYLEYAAADEHQQNAFAERAMRGLEDMIRANLLDSNKSLGWWAEAAAHATVHHNAIPSAARGWKAPNQLWGGVVRPWHKLSRLRRFGSHGVAVKTTQERGGSQNIKTVGAPIRVLGYDLNSSCSRRDAGWLCETTRLCLH